MTTSSTIEIRYLGADFAVADPGPDDRVEHRFDILVLDDAGQPPVLGPCGLVSAELDHGVTIDVDPLRYGGLVRSRLEIPGASLISLGEGLDPDDDPDDRSDAEPLTRNARDLLVDLFGPTIAGVMSDPSLLRNVGDVETTSATTDSWESARQLARIESEARRQGAPTDLAYSLWAAESALYAAELSPALHDWAAGRARSAAPALALLPLEDTRRELGDLWETFLTLLGAVEHGADLVLLGELAGVRQPPRTRTSLIEHVRAALTAIAGTLSPEALYGPLITRGAYQDVAGTTEDRLDTAISIDVSSEAAAAVNADSLRVEAGLSDDEFIVSGRLNSTAGTLATADPGFFALELGARYWDLDTSTFLGDSGIEIEGTGFRTTVRIPSRQMSSSSRIVVEIFRRGHDRLQPPLQSYANRAMLLSRCALESTSVLLDLEPDRHRAQELRRAARDWKRATAAWADAGVADLAERCDELDHLCLQAAADPTAGDDLRSRIPEPLVTDLIRPGIRRVIQQQARSQMGEIVGLSWNSGQEAAAVLDRATTFAKVARTLGLLRESAELTVAILELQRARNEEFDADVALGAAWDAMSANAASAAQAALRLSRSALALS